MSHRGPRLPEDGVGLPGGYGAEPLAVQERPVALARPSLVPNEDVRGQHSVWIGECTSRPPDPEKAARRPARSLIIFTPRRFIPALWRTRGCRRGARSSVVEEVVRQREFYVNRGRVAILQRRAPVRFGARIRQPAKA